jgi:hypothetical protein
VICQFLLRQSTNWHIRGIYQGFTLRRQKFYVLFIGIYNRQRVIDKSLRLREDYRARQATKEQSILCNFYCSDKVRIDDLLGNSPLFLASLIDISIRNAARLAVGRP